MQWPLDVGSRHRSAAQSVSMEYKCIQTNVLIKLMQQLIQQKFHFLINIYHGFTVSQMFCLCLISFSLSHTHMHLYTRKLTHLQSDDLNIVFISGLILLLSICFRSLCLIYTVDVTEIDCGCDRNKTGA